MFQVMQVIMDEGVTFQIAFFDDFVCFFKKVTFQIASKFYWRLFLLFKKVKICLLPIYHVVMWETNFSFFSFFEKSRRSRQTQSETSFFWKADQVVKKRNLKRFSRWSHQNLLTTLSRKWWSSMESILSIYLVVVVHNILIFKSSYQFGWKWILFLLMLFLCLILVL